MTLSIAKRATHWDTRPALVVPDGSEPLTYRDLDDLISRVAGRFDTLGTGPGDRIVVLARNDPQVLAGLFAARRLGATLAPISHRLAAETIDALVDRIDPALAIVDDVVDANITDGDARTVSLAEFRRTDPAEYVHGPDDAPPLFLHTGGTTGNPKVVPIGEEQLEWNAITESVAWGLDDETICLTLLPLFHTGGWNLLTLPTLYSGGTVVLPKDFDPGQTLSLIESHEPAQLFAVPAIYRALAEHADFPATDLASLEWVMSGGGPCPEPVMEPYRERNVPFVQGYGLTEGGPNDLYLDPDRSDRETKSDRVGRPFPDCSVRLVDDGTVIEGTGTGELELRGPVTADRYLDTDDGTFAGDWVSTGDVAHRDEDGDFAIVGRTDNAFVSGGENVYPERIEDVLGAHPDVEAVGVLPIAHERWGTVPKAVVVGDAETDTLIAVAAERLADFEQPQTYEFVDALPETGAGKLDRDALGEQYGSASEEG